MQHGLHIKNIAGAVLQAFKFFIFKKFRALQKILILELKMVEMSSLRQSNISVKKFWGIGSVVGEKKSIVETVKRHIWGPCWKHIPIFQFLVQLRGKLWEEQNQKNEKKPNQKTTS